MPLHCTFAPQCCAVSAALPVVSYNAHRFVVRCPLRRARLIGLPKLLEARVGLCVARTLPTASSPTHKRALHAAGSKQRQGAHSAIGCGSMTAEGLPGEAAPCRGDTCAPSCSSPAPTRVCVLSCVRAFARMRASSRARKRACARASAGERVWRFTAYSTVEAALGRLPS